MPQGVFGTAGTDPTVNMPVLGANSANFWMDVQITDVASAGTSYVGYLSPTGKDNLPSIGCGPTIQQFPDDQFR